MAAVNERLAKLETQVNHLVEERDRSINTISEANKLHFNTLSGSVESLSKHITAETNRWLKAFYWIAFALLAGGLVTVGNTKLAEKIFEMFLKAI